MWEGQGEARLGEARCFDMQGRFPFGDDYERRKERARKREAEQSQSGREIGPLPEVLPLYAVQVELCRNDLRAFLEIFLKQLYPLPWSPAHLEAIELLQDAILNGGSFAYAMARGYGKTALVLGAVVWAICYGHRRAIVLVAATGPLAVELVDDLKTIVETYGLLGLSFPAVCYPVRKLEGINNRVAGQLLNSERTRLKWTAKKLAFATVPGAASSGVTVRAFGMLAAARGLKAVDPETGELERPDLIVPDDPQTDDSARSPAQTEKRMRIFRKVLLKLAGPKRKIAFLVPCTIIEPDDLAAQVLDRERMPEMRGRKTRAMEVMPSAAAMKLWGQYREVRRDSFREFGDARAATEFYRQNLEPMRESAVCSWPERFEPGQVDGIQYAMDKWAEDEESFWSELQNEPRHYEQAGVETLRAAELLERCNGGGRGELPKWSIAGASRATTAERSATITAFVDIQQDLLPWMVVAWGEDLRGRIVDYGAWPKQLKRYYTLREVSPTLRAATDSPTVEAGIEAGLELLTAELLDKYPAMAWFGGDANWPLSTEIVYQWSRRRSICVPFHGRFVGAASQPMREWKKKPGQRNGHFWRSVLNGNVRVLEADSNSWKTLVLQRLREPVESGRGITWFGDKPFQHEMLCDQLSAEYSVATTGRGRRVHEWKNRPGRDNHWWDCLVGCAVGASVVGLELPGQQKTVKPKRLTAAEIAKLRRGA